jgi:hypothetical protein
MSKRKIRVSWMRFKRWMGRITNSNDKLDESQKMGLRIFEKCVSIKDSEIFLSPLSDTIYIEVDDIYIILERSDVQIINGRFQYDLHYPESARVRMRNRVFDVLESRRVEVENRVKAKSDKTLNSILSEIEEIKRARNGD